MINVLSTTNDLIKIYNYATKHWKGVIAKKRNIFSFVCSKYFCPPGQIRT